MVNSRINIHCGYKKTLVKFTLNYWSEARFIHPKALNGYVLYELIGFVYFGDNWCYNLTMTYLNYNIRIYNTDIAILPHFVQVSFYFCYFCHHILNEFPTILVFHFYKTTFLSVKYMSVSQGNWLGSLFIIISRVKTLMFRMFMWYFFCIRWRFASYPATKHGNITSTVMGKSELPFLSANSFVNASPNIFTP